ncbi:hypothetical protein SOQ14_12735 [Erythrobacter sp. T5W1-R]|uniref:hypothetical protein n=1 Tax=Erythrobacter sp. T5W1-R TaxID=3101752 RepID=UPI002AFFE10F|nr:hypothetical protein [Erythrobacter sp. T5W1-R]MEA1619782.1 hypothetical protein [Erythrobacter sp. T5W1-R]
MEYSIEIDASRGLVKASGDKDFVMSVIDRYDSLMAHRKPAPAVGEAAPHTPSTSLGNQPNSPAVGGQNLDDFGSVYDVTEGKVRIITSVPGNTQAAKAKNLCLLFLFAKLKLGHEIIPNEEVREVCKDHAVYDPTNFASQMKGQKKFVIASGTKGSPNFTLKLTVPGRKAAEELARSLESAT